MSGAAAPSVAAELLQLDLAFGEPAAESAFRSHAAAINSRTVILSTALRVVFWCFVVLQLKTAHDQQGALLAALCAASDGAFFAMHVRCAACMGIGEPLDTLCARSTSATRPPSTSPSPDPHAVHAGCTSHPRVP